MNIKLVRNQILKKYNMKVNFKKVQQANTIIHILRHKMFLDI